MRLGSNSTPRPRGPGRRPRQRDLRRARHRQRRRAAAAPAGATPYSGVRAPDRLGRWIAETTSTASRCLGPKVEPGRRAPAGGQCLSRWRPEPSGPVNRRCGMVFRCGHAVAHTRRCCRRPPAGAGRGCSGRTPRSAWLCATVEQNSWAASKRHRRSRLAGGTVCRGRPTAPPPSSFGAGVAIPQAGQPVGRRSLRDGLRRLPPGRGRPRATRVVVAVTSATAASNTGGGRRQIA